MKKVLFVCTYNSARSQMAEGLLNHLSRFPLCKGESEGISRRYIAFSAGTVKTEVNPLAVKAMAELGIDISKQFSKDLNYFSDEQFDLAITVCDNAAEACPNISTAKKILHWSFPDPSQATGTEEERLKVFRSIRGQIAKQISDFFQLSY